MPRSSQCRHVESVHCSLCTAQPQQQFSLFDPANRPPEPQETSSEAGRYDRDFAAFHQANPQVYRKLVELSRMVRSRGFDAYSIKSLFEQVRWHYHIETNDPDFKLNNNYHSRYARLIMAQEKDLNEFFELRVLATEKEGAEFRGRRAS